MNLPLEGLLVTDLTAYWAGPFCTKFLADFGATVVKVESPVHPDVVRITLTSPATHGPDYYNKSAYFNNYSRNKLSLGLDIGAPAGRDTLLKLVAKSDIVAENLRADVMDNLGLGYDTMKSVKADIIMLSLSAFGKTGPLRRFAGIGTTMEQMSGLASLNTYGDEVPYNTGIAYGDPNAGVMGVAAVVMALMQRDATGIGSFIDLSQQENLICLFGEQVLDWFWNGRNPLPQGNGSMVMAPHGCYPCEGNDRWLTVAIQTDAEWHIFAAAIGKPELASIYPDLLSRLSNTHEIDAEIASWTVTQDAAEVASLLQAKGIAASPVLDAVDLIGDPQMKARGFFEMVDDADLGRWAYDGIAWRLMETPGSIRTPAPRFGQHNDHVLREIVGLSQADVEDLRAGGAVADSF